MTLKNTLTNYFGKVLLGITLLTPLNSYSAEPSQTSPVQQSKSNLEELAKTGLPKEFKEMGFTIGDYVKRNSDKELIILAENHLADGVKRKEEKIIQFLIEKHKADSLGLEGCSGEYPDVKSPIMIDIFARWSAKEYLGKNKIPLYGLSTYQIMNNEIRIESTTNFLLGKYTYDKARTLLEKVNSTEFENDKFLGGKSIFTDPTKIQEVMKNLNETQLPEDIKKVYLKCIKADKIEKQEILEILRFQDKFTLEERTRDFAKNIKYFAEKNNSKKGIIIIGSAHVHSDIVKMKNLQDFLPYSYLLIYTPGIDKEKTEKSMPLLFSEERRIKLIENINKAVKEKLKEKSQ